MTADPEYTSSGLFALTDPTGASKSTILDAIASLRGATPAWENHQNANEIMSRQTGECYAEVLFESRPAGFGVTGNSGGRGKKPEGKLQVQEHQISDEVTGKPIETKKVWSSGSSWKRLAWTLTGSPIRFCWPRVDSTRS